MPTDINAYHFCTGVMLNVSNYKVLVICILSGAICYRIRGHPLPFTFLYHVTGSHLTLGCQFKHNFLKLLASLIFQIFCRTLQDMPGLCKDHSRVSHNCLFQLLFLIFSQNLNSELLSAIWQLF